MSFKKTVLAAVFTTVSGMSVSANAAPSAEVTLQGIITSSTCDVIVNGGKSVLNIGVFRAADFKPNTKLGATTLPVSLTNCTVEETGNLIIQGLTSLTNNDKNVFVNNDANTVGFMIANANGDILTNGQGIPASVKAGETSNINFTVGMASTALAPKAGVYSAPVLVAYIVE